MMIIDQAIINISRFSMEILVVCSMNCWTDHMWNFWGMGWGMWIWVLILVLIGVGYLFYLSYISRGHRVEREDPLEVARLRLARGEITSKEFEELKKTLEKSR